MIMEKNIIERIKEKLEDFWKAYCDYHQYDPLSKIDPKLFDYIYTREDVSNKKPAPDMGHLIFEKT